MFRHFDRHLTLKNKQKLLAHVAGQTFSDGDYFIEEEKLANLIEKYLTGVPGLKEEEPDGITVLRVMEAQHGIFVARAWGYYSFSHLTLQEYYTALYIKDNEAGGTLLRLMKNVGDDHWREVFLLTPSMLSDATNFCHLYLQALQQMVAGDKELIALLQWGAVKSAQANTTAGKPLPAFHAFYIFLARFRARAYDLDLARELDLDLTPRPLLALDYLLGRLLSVAELLALVGATAMNDNVPGTAQLRFNKSRNCCTV